MHIATAFLSLLLASSTANAACFRGINLSGAEFGDRSGIHGQQYVYPSQKMISYFSGKGMNTIRLPFLWERLQPKLGEELNADELSLLKTAVDQIRAAGMNVILDPHNYAEYDRKQLNTGSATDEDFADFWKRLATEFANRNGVSFGLMNEPHDMAADKWLNSANAAIAAIRQTGANNLILVPGTNWTGAHSWQVSNADVMINTVDPANNYAFEFHQYLDSDFSGTHDTCERADDAVKAIKDVTKWLKANGKRGFMGEFGGSKSPECLTGLARMVDVMNEEKDVWTGWTYWVAGDWWPESEALNITPTPSGDRVQLKALLRPGLLDTSCGGM